MKPFHMILYVVVLIITVLFCASLISQVLSDEGDNTYTSKITEYDETIYDYGNGIYFIKTNGDRNTLGNTLSRFVENKHIRIVSMAVSVAGGEYNNIVGYWIITEQIEIW